MSTEGAELWREGHNRDRDAERQAELANISNAGLSPEAAQEAIATLYKKDPSALKQHIQNLVGRLRGQQPQPTPDAYPAQSVNVAQPSMQLGGGPSQPDTSQFMAVPNPQGLVEPGNLPIANRPVVQNADGSKSTEYSTSFQDDQGHEVIVPTVVNGKFLTPDGKKPKEGSPEEQAMFKAAWQHYLQTGENLGKFDSSQNADAYADQLHSRGERPPNVNLPAPRVNIPTLSQQVSQPAAHTQADRRAQILSGGTTPQQRALELADERQRALAPRNQTPTDVLGALMADDVGKGIDPATDPRVQQVASLVKEQQRQPAPKQKKAAKIITGTGGEPIGVTAEDEDGNQKNYTAKDMKDAPPEVQELFKADQAAYADKERHDEQKQAATFSREVALLGARVSDSISIADYRSAKKAIDDAQKKATDAGVQSSIMEKAAPAAKQQDGAAMYTVLANFVKSAVGGTGMRVTQTEWNQAQQTRPWLQGVKAQFGPDGYLTGVKLAPEQIDSMVREGRQKSQAMNEAVDTVKEQHADDLQEGDELRGGNSKGKGPAPKKAAKKGVVSLAKARTLSQYKGKSDAEIKAAAEARGYEVKQ